MNHVKQLRKSGRIEVKFLIAASFCKRTSPTVGRTSIFVDLWGNGRWKNSFSYGGCQHMGEPG